MPLPFLKSKTSADARPDDPLAQFEAESAFSLRDVDSLTSPDTSSTDAEPDASLAALAVAEPLALEQVLARGIAVSWVEAIAIVEATCGALTRSDGSELPAPDPSHILLTAAGTIQVRSGFGFGRSDSVQRLARTLHTLTSGQAIPAPLRLFVSKWIAVDGSHSVGDFARELTYFARPNGADLIREVYLRASAAVARVQAATPSARRTEPEAPKSPTSPPQAARPRRAALVIAGVSLVTAIAAGIGVARSQPAGEGASSDLLTNLLARAAEFARSLGEVRTQLGDLSAQLSAHLAAGDEPAAASPAPTPAGGRGTSGRGRGGIRPNAAASASARGSSTSPLPDATPSSVPSAVLSEVPTSAPEATPAELVEAAPPAPAAPIVVPDPDFVYSDADADVNPPKMTYPHLPPAPLVLGTPTNNVNVMEIIIDNRGSVEKVRLVSPPRRMTDMMLLSGAKSWKFAPASKGGFPVRYRIAVSWATTP